MTVSARASLSQVLWFAALATTGLALFSAASRRTRAAAVLLAVIGAVTALLILPRNLSDTSSQIRLHLRAPRTRPA